MAKKPVMLTNNVTDNKNIISNLSPSKTPKISVSHPLPTSSDLDIIVDAFNQLTSSSYEIPPAKENEDNYRQVLIPGWPRNIHYEFITRKSASKGRKPGLCIEFHDENGGFLRLKELLPNISETIGAIDGVSIGCLEYFKNPALVAQIPASKSSSDAAESMLELIRRTKDSINTAISGTR